jgi:hypothetical protein
MKQVNLIVFHYLGATLNGIKRIKTDDKVWDVVLTLISPRQSLRSFLDQTIDISVLRSREAAEHLLKWIEYVIDDWINNLKVTDPDKTLDKNTRDALIAGIKSFEDEFALECRDIDVFAVTSKGIYNTRALIESAERKFPKNLLDVMPQVTIQDLREAGRCLAFELPTACAFHICRATEALMLTYFEALTGTAWSLRRRDWNTYNNQLHANGALSAITNRLGEIREDRNAYTHPEITVPLDEAIVVFDLCNGVIHLMAKEIEKIEAAKNAASNPSTPS